MPGAPLIEALSCPLYYWDLTWRSRNGNLQLTLSTYVAQLAVVGNLRARNLRVARNPAMIAVQVVLQVVA